MDANKQPHLHQATSKQKIYNAEGMICQMRNCGHQFISFFIPEKSQIQIFDPARQIIVRKFELPQRIIEEGYMVEHIITNDLNKLILVWEKQNMSEIYEYSSNKLLERLKGQILGYFNNKIVLIKFRDDSYLFEDYDWHILTIDFMSRYHQQYQLKTKNKAKFYTFKNLLLITNEKQTELQFINLIWKKIQIQFKQSLSYPQINYYHNSNYFLLGFQKPNCLRFLVKQTYRFKQIKKILIKSKLFSMIEIGQSIIYCDKDSKKIYKMNLYNLLLTEAAKGGEVNQIQCTQNKKYFTLSRQNMIYTLELSI